MDYQTLQKHLAYPLCDVISHVRKNTQNFPEITFLEKDLICSGSTYGEMPNHTFSPNPVHAKKAFELIHLDLKSIPTDLYQKYKYLIVFIDDYTGFAWTLCMWTKSESIKYMCDFITLVSMQHNSKIIKWMSNTRGEYKSNTFDALLKQHRIKILQSALHTPQQNGHAERFIYTMMDKAEAMCHEACILPSYWEFAIQHAVHIYNQTPMKQLNWHTPYELLLSEVSDISTSSSFQLWCICPHTLKYPDEQTHSKIQTNNISWCCNQKQVQSYIHAISKQCNLHICTYSLQ